MPAFNNPPVMTTDIKDDFFLTRDWLLLNNGSFGACPKPVFEEYQRWQRVLEDHPGNYFHRLHEYMDNARAPLAEYLHTSSDQLAFVTNATMGVNVATHSLRSWLRESDQILTSDHEYGACNHAWEFVCTKTGARYIRRHMPLPVRSAEDWVEQFWAGVNPRTRVIYLSHTTSPTALTFPIKEVCRRAREQGILTVIDGAHVPGQRDLNLEDIGADFYTGNCHKWMCAPKGSAFLYVRKDMQHLIEPLIVGHGWRPDHVSEKPLVDYVEQFGTRDMAAFMTVPAAIAYLNEHDWPAVRQRCFSMALDARHRIEGKFDTESVCPDDFEWFSQLAPIRLPDRVNMHRLSMAIREEFKIEIPLITWHNVKIARLSVQIYTSQDEIDTFIAALEKHVPACME
jgi:isopenicillin-N epimerase